MREIISQIPLIPIEYKFVIIFTTAVSISFLLIPRIIRFSIKYGWVDVPDGRKIHLRSIPNLGGIAIFAGLLIASLSWFDFFLSTDYIFIIISVLILFFTGIFDDIKGMRAKKKLLFQIIAASISVAGGIKISSFQGMFGIYELPAAVQYGFTILVIVGVVNAYNLMDGIDGLAGGIGIINFSALGYIFYDMNHISYALLSFAVAGSLLGFLVYNFNPAKIFMGDTGALIMGFLTVVLGIKAVEFNLLPVGDYSSKNIILLVSCIMFLPVFDTLRVLSMRLTKKKSPFTPGRDHLHHLLLARGMKPSEVAVTLYVLNILIILIGFSYNHIITTKLFINSLIITF